MFGKRKNNINNFACKSCKQTYSIHPTVAKMIGTGGIYCKSCHTGLKDKNGNAIGVGTIISKKTKMRDSTALSYKMKAKTTEQEIHEELSSIQIGNE